MEFGKKISELKKIIQEIKDISKNSENNNVFEKKIHDLNNEISRLKKGINESVEELEEYLKDDNARS